MDFRAHAKPRLATTHRAAACGHPRFAAMLQNANTPPDFREILNSRAEKSMDEKPDQRGHKHSALDQRRLVFYHPLVDLVPRDQISEFLGDVERSIEKCVDILPTNAEFIVRHCAASGQQ